jgi:hypothetical protein
MTVLEAIPNYNNLPHDLSAKRGTDYLIGGAEIVDDLDSAVHE